MAGSDDLRVRVSVRHSDSSAPRLAIEATFAPGITAVIGSSGAGKSTLLHTIAGLVVPDEGHIQLADTVLFDHAAKIFLPPHLRRIALVFQSLALFPHLSAWENVAYGLRSSSANAREQAMHWLQRTQCAHVAERKPATLSGGEAQRVALARALASEPRALLLDEPFSALDTKLRTELAQELTRLVTDINIPVLLVTHDQTDLSLTKARVLRLHEGALDAT